MGGGWINNGCDDRVPQWSGWPCWPQSPHKKCDSAGCGKTGWCSIFGFLFARESCTKMWRWRWGRILRVTVLISTSWEDGASGELYCKLCLGVLKRTGRWLSVPRYLKLSTWKCCTDFSRKIVTRSLGGCWYWVWAFMLSLQATGAMSSAHKDSPSPCCRGCYWCNRQMNEE